MEGIGRSPDETHDCSKKATTAEDFGQLTLENDGQYTDWFIGIHLSLVSYNRYYEFGDLDHIPIDTIDDCEVEGDEVFSVYSRAQPLEDMSQPSVPVPTDGLEIIIVDNDGKSIRP